MSDTDDRLTTVHTETKLYPSSTRSWLPCLDSIHQRSTWDLFFSVPACAGSLDDPQSLLPLTVVSSGELSSLVIHPQDPLKRIYRYIMSTATPACTLGFAIGPFTSACTLDGSLLSNGESSDSQTEQNVTASQTEAVVFMDGLREPIISCASLTIVSTDFLHPRFIIEQVYETRRCLGLAIAQQWFGTYIVPETWSDYWLVVGLAGYIASLFVKHNLGNNEHRYRLKRDMTRLCHADVNQRPISYPEQPPVVRQDEVEFVQLKAPIILYMIDRRMMKGGMSLGLHRIVPKILVAAMSGDLGISNAVGTTWFLKMCRKVSGVDLQVFSDQWIFGTGCPVFHFSYAFNRKKLAVEIMMHQESTNSKATAPWAKPQLFDGQMTARIREADGTPYEHVLDIHESWKKFEVQFNTKYKRIRRSTKRFHMRQMAAAAEELNVNAEVLGIEDDDETYSNIALFGAENEQEKRDWRVVEWGEDDEESLASATFEWIRMDSDMEWACIIHFEQPDFMWAAQLQKDRDVAAQLEAVDALQHLPSSAASTTLMRTVMDGRVFYRIRVDAALALEKFAKESLDWIGLHHLIKIYKNRYCLPPPPSLRGTSGDNQGDSEDISVARLPRPNNFANIGEYFTQKAILAALSNIRDKNNEAPLAARRVMMGALKYNDNSENVYSDCNFLSNLIRALTNSIINSKRFSRMYSIGAAPRGDDAVLNEIERLRKLDMMVPSYHNIVTRGCMEVLLRLMATPDAYVAVREVAVGGLILHWGPSDPIFSKFFVALATDTDSPRLATTTSRYLMELMMIRAMAYGQQHNSLLFMEERGKEVVEYIDTDARLVGGMESFIDSIDDSSELRTIFSSAMYDSTLTHSSQLLLGAFNVLIYQIPQVKVKLKLKFAKTSSPAQPETPLPQQQQSSSVAAHHHHFSPTMSPPLIHSTVPRVSSPLAAHSDSPSRRSHGRGTPSAWSPAYNPPEIDTSTEFGVPRERQRADSYPVLKDEYPLDNIGQNNEGADSQNQMASVNVGGSLEKTGKIKRAKTEKTAKATQPNSSGLSSATQKLLTRILRKISKHHSAFPFSRPVDVVLDGCPTYYDIIKHPMDLGTIKTKLESPGRYSNTDEFETDIRLMLSNCYAFNPAGTPVYMMGKEVENIFEKDEAASFNNMPEDVHIEGEAFVVPAKNSKAASVKLKVSKTLSTQNQPQSVSSEPIGVNNLDDPDAIMEYLDKTDGLHASEAKSKPATKQRIVDFKAMCNRVLLRLQAQASALEFMAPVDPEKQGVPTYPLIVKNPMDLGTVRKKLDRNVYKSAEEFCHDVCLVLSNCFLFNKPGTYVHTQGETLNRIFKSVWKQHTGVDDPEDVMELQQPYEEIPMGDKEVERARSVINKLKRDDSAWPFLKPVDPVALGVPTYFDIVKNPMDLSTVQKKLGKKAYKWVADFAADIQLIVDDCFLFNLPDTPVYDCGKAFKNAASKLLEPDSWNQWLAPS
ncbi:hypothetical protein BX070DRAFT_196268 [Coemansia spiralis]|nr:hypothetical protein BX070DRAFT_196268 [Coemansia spiralis]